jgi:hypothetical protein
MFNRKKKKIQELEQRVDNLEKAIFDHSVTFLKGGTTIVGLKTKVSLLADAMGFEFRYNPPKNCYVKKED